MSSSGEMRGFMFAVVFIVLFSTLVSTIPAGLQGAEETPSEIAPVDPSLVSGFETYENWSKSDYTGGSYEYELVDFDSFVSTYTSLQLIIGSKIMIWFLWFGGINYCKFFSSAGGDRGATLQFTEITADADEGEVRYSLQRSLGGSAAGYLVCYWNTTAWDNATIAWDNDELNLIHGIGFELSATNNIFALLVSLLFLQLPEVPLLINALIVLPIWACIIYVLWFIFKETIPFN